MRTLTLIAGILLAQPAMSWASCDNIDDLRDSPISVQRILVTDQPMDSVPEPDQEGSGLSMRVKAPGPMLNQIEKTDGIDGNRGVVFFFETDPKGKERVCRTEQWQRPYSGENPDYLAAETKRQLQQHGHQPQLAALIKQGYFMAAANGYRYDAKGQLTEVVTFKADTDPAYNHYRTVCFAYDDLGRVVFYTQVDGAKNCTNAERNPRDINRYSYVNRTQPWLARKTVDYVDEKSNIRRQHINGFAHLGSPFFDAKLDEKRGLYELSGTPNTPLGGVPSIQWDIADRNAINAKTQHFIYYFPSPGPASLLNDLTKVSTYDRVRVSYVHPNSGADQINEVITAQGQLIARYFADGGAFRQDMFKEGKLIRVLISRGAEHIGNKDSLLYYEDPAPLQAFAAKKRTTVQNLSARVYDVLPSGQWRLVAAGWARYPKQKKNWLRLRKESSVIVGVGGTETVDGKKTWDDDQAMLREYGFDRAMKLAQKFGKPDPTY